MGKAIADGTVEDLFFGILDRFRQFICILLRKTDEMEGNALGGFGSDTRDFLDLVNEPVQRMILYEH
jgi:hypothetical protein